MATTRQPRTKAVKPSTRGQRVIAFIERYCRVPEGNLVGQPLILDEFQRRFILAVYDNPRAATSRAYLSIARKNGKTALTAAIVLAHVCGPEAVLNSQVVSGARSRDQASLVFKLAAKMVRLNSELQAVVRIVPSTKTLIGVSRNVEYQALSAEGKTAHGLSPILAVLDEVGQVRGSHDDFIEAIETAQGAHEQPLLLAISTQAPSDADLFSIWLDDAAKWDDPSIVSHLYAAPLDADLDSREAWRAANPALGRFRMEEDVAKQAQRAKRMPAFEPSFRNLTLNQRVQASSPFVSRSVWEGNKGAPDPDAFIRNAVVAGLDLSARTDLTGMVLVAEDDDGVWHVMPFFWTPEEGLRERSLADRAPYDRWVDQGFIFTTPGRSIDYDFVARDIMARTADMSVEGIAFDRWRIDVLAAAFARADATPPLKPFGQGFKDMSPALDALEEALLNNRVRHGGHPVLTMCAANATVVRDPADNRKLTKAKSNGRIDGLVALAMAAGLRAVDESEDAPPAVLSLEELMS